MNKQVFVSILIFCFFWCVGCSTDSSPSLYVVTASVSPSEAGSVNPSNMEIEDGNRVTVVATENQGWRFKEWTGDLMATENPLNHTVEEDINITANFSDITSDYSVEMTISDGVDDIQVQFGQRTDPSSMSEQVPPSPPTEFLHAYFEKENKTWWKDYRENFQTEVTWKLKYQRGQSDNIILNWNIDASKLEGTLVLESQNGSVEVDMNSEDSIDLPNDISETLQIHYLLE